jgi:hypothetical protein
MNSLTICRENYESQDEFENAIKKAVMLLLEARYIMTVRYDEPGLGIVCINFETDRQEWGCPYPYWLTPTEFESVTYDKK